MTYFPETGGTGTFMPLISIFLILAVLFGLLLVIAAAVIITIVLVKKNKKKQQTNNKTETNQINNQ